MDIRFIRTKEDKKFISTAVAYKSPRREEDGIVGGETIIFVDTRPRVTESFGFQTRERVITLRGLGYAIGINISGQAVVELDDPPFILLLGAQTSHSVEHLRAIRTQSDKDFVKIATKYQSKGGDTLFVDTRAETTLPLGFLHNDRLTTPQGLAVAVGIDIDARFVLQLDNFPIPAFFFCQSKEDLDQNHIRAIRTPREKEFINTIARPHTTKRGQILHLDQRPTDGLTFPIGDLRPGERFATPKGLATAIGFDIDGVFVMQVDDELDVTWIDSNSPLFQRKKYGFQPIRTTEDKTFVKIADKYKSKTNQHFLVDTRLETLQTFGLRPRGHIGFRSAKATVIGFDIEHKIILEFDHMPEPAAIPCRTFNDLEMLGFYHVDGAKNKLGNNKAVKDSSEKGKGGTLNLQQPANPAAKNTASTNNNNKSKANSFHQGKATRPGNSTTTINPAMTGTTGKKQPTISREKATLTHATAQTVVLESGARYIGEHTKAGLRHGRGLLRGADRSWQYKGQWQRGLPHGSGTMRVGVGRRSAARAEDVYEGQWACGVPHGSGTLTTRDGRRYRGKWQHGRRVMGGAELTAVRLSGGEAMQNLQQDRRPKEQKKIKTKGQKQHIQSQSQPKNKCSVRVFFCAHVETQSMTRSVATACGSRDSAPGTFPLPATSRLLREIRIAQPLPKTKSTLCNFLATNM